jgi:hypothetical protein
MRSKDEFRSAILQPRPSSRRRRIPLKKRQGRTGRAKPASGHLSTIEVPVTKGVIGGQFQIAECKADKTSVPLEFVENTFVWS